MTQEDTEVVGAGFASAGRAQTEESPANSLSSPLQLQEVVEEEPVELADQTCLKHAEVQEQSPQLVAAVVVEVFAVQPWLEPVPPDRSVVAARLALVVPDTLFRAGGLGPMALQMVFRVLQAQNPLLSSHLAPLVLEDGRIWKYRGP